MCLMTLYRREKEAQHRRNDELPNFAGNSNSHFDRYSLIGRQFSENSFFFAELWPHRIALDVITKCNDCAVCIVQSVDSIGSQ